MADSSDPDAAANEAAFDEEIYLRLNPDVRLAVAGGGFRSGREHYERYGRAEGRPFVMPQGVARGRIVMTANPDMRREKAPSPAAAVDALRLSNSGGILVTGWIDDAADPLDRLDLYFSTWFVSLDGRSLARQRRPDTEQALAALGRHSYGFIGFLFAARRLTGSVCSVVARLKSGAEISLMVTAEMSEDHELRKLALSGLAQAKYSGNPNFEAMAAVDGAIGEQMVDFNKMLSRRAVNAPYVERFGGAGRGCKGSIIVCLYGRAEYMFLQQAMFAKLPGIGDYEFIYVLNSPWLAEPVLCEARRCALIYGLAMTVVILNANAGFGAANNAAAEHAGADRLLFMNPDVFAREDGWALRHSGIIEALPAEQTALFGAPLYYDDGSLMHAGMYFCEDTLPVFSGRRIEETSILRVEPYGRGAPPQSEALLRARAVPAVSGAFMSVARGWFEQLGGFTPDYVFGGYEDADLCLKSIEAGRLPWLHDAPLWHMEGQGGLRQPQHEGGAVINRWLFTRSWSEMVHNGLLGAAPVYPGLGGEDAP
jgi:GT2 family glycosyltransferase